MPYINQPGGGSGKISGVTVTGSAVSGNVPVASSATAGAWAFPPGFEINYTQITAGVNIASTTEATGTTVISPGAITFDGSPVLVHFSACQLVLPNLTTQNATNSMTISLFEGATQITRLAFAFDNENIGAGGVAVQIPVSAFYRFTPSAASHTYTITASVSNTTGTPSIQAGAGGTATDSPAFVRFTKV